MNLVPSVAVDFILFFSSEGLLGKARLRLFLLSKDNDILDLFGIKRWWMNHLIGTQGIAILGFSIAESCIAIGHLRNCNIFDWCCFTWLICLAPCLEGGNEPRVGS